MIKIKKLFLFVVLSSTTTGAMNLSTLSDIFLKPAFDFDTCFQLGVLAEIGVNSKTFDCANCVGNPLRLWNKDQDALKMLQGFPSESAIGKLATLIDAADDGVRGHFLVDGCMDLLYNLSFTARYNFCDDFLISAYLPFRSLRLRNVSWCNLTQNITAQDERVRTYLTDDFFANVCELGGLNLQGWRRTGFGDLMVLVEWFRDFPQAKPMLKNVMLDARFGPSIPTGLKQDEDLLLALPFGYDGAWGIVFGGGLEATLSIGLKAGVDVQLTPLFGNTKNRRIKTDVSQTELLLLQKVCAFRDWGLVQQFNIYAQLFNCFKGLSLALDYQFIKQGESNLSFDVLDFSPTVANTACSLQEWTSHSAIFKATYDFAYHDTWRVKPQFSFYAKVPFNGNQSVLFTTVGVIGAINF